uniref:Uncharacterized protein n=1 Tax=Glossina austeni TaxID=7395 RepID=A0A1A9UDM2_GLOAU
MYNGLNVVTPGHKPGQFITNQNQGKIPQHQLHKAQKSTNGYSPPIFIATVITEVKTITTVAFIEYKATEMDCPRKKLSSNNPGEPIANILSISEELKNGIHKHS